MWPAMAVTARRTVANVKSSAMMPRQPEVPNLMGEAIFGEALMAGYSTRSGIVHKDECEREKDGTRRSLEEEKITSLSRLGVRRAEDVEGREEKCGTHRAQSLDTEVTEKRHDSEWRATSGCVGYVRVDCGGAKNRARGCGAQASGLREYCFRRRVDLPMEREGRAGTRSVGHYEDYSDAAARIGKGSEALAQLRRAGIHRAANRGRFAGIFEMDRREFAGRQGLILSLQPQRLKLRKLSDVEESLVQIGDYVFHVFDAYGEAH